MLAICSSDISSFRDFGIRHAKKLSNSKAALASLNNLKQDPDTIIDLHTKLQSIEFTIQNYKHSSLLRKVIDFVTGNYFKLLFLQKSIPEIAAEVNKIATPLILKKKQQLILEVEKEFYKSESKNEQAWDITARHVHEYIQGKRILLIDRKQDTPLPRWFHATKVANWNSIAKSKIIEQRSAALGKGAFVSTNDESLYSYGPYTFALDSSAIETHQAAYYPSRESLKNELYASLWVRVEHDIILSPNTVAHFVVENAREVHEKGVELLTTLNLEVPVITREVSLRVHELFDRVLSKRHLPKAWRRHESYSFSLFSNNIVEYAEKGIEIA